MGSELGSRYGAGGVSAFPLHGSTAAEVMKVADEALFRAKQRAGDDIFAFAG